MKAHVTNLLGCRRGRRELIGSAAASRMRPRCIDELPDADAQAAAKLSSLLSRSGRQNATRTGRPVRRSAASATECGCLTAHVRHWLMGHCEVARALALIPSTVAAADLTNLVASMQWPGRAIPRAASEYNASEKCQFWMVAGCDLRSKLRYCVRDPSAPLATSHPRLQNFPADHARCCAAPRPCFRHFLLDPTPQLLGRTSQHVCTSHGGRGRV